MKNCAINVVFLKKLILNKKKQNKQRMVVLIIFMIFFLMLSLCVRNIIINYFKEKLENII